jgi:hypothetical protein
MAMIQNKVLKLQRNDIADLSSECVSASTDISVAIDYLDGNTRPHVLQAIADRFAVELVKGEDPSGAATSYRVRSKSAAKAAIEGGMFEAASTHLYPRVNRERATLFAYGEEYEYSPAGIADDIEAAREEAGRKLVMQRLDWIACGTGSAALLVQILGSKYDYQAIARDKIWIVFSDEITETTERGERVRPTNTTNIEEATAIVIAMSGTDENGRQKFVAIFGRSAECENGRMVTYYADSWELVPQVGAKDASDYLLDDGSIANPLTYWRNKQNDPTLPEYPVAPWIGDSSGSTTEIMPVDLGLFNQSKEYDVSFSRVLTASLKSARGAWEFHRDQGASNVVPDAIDEGMFATEQGQSVTAHSVAGSNSESALAVIRSGMSDTATAFGVPSYKLGLTADTAVQSGVALAIMNAPLMADRSRRIELNRANMARIFRIECALASMENGAPIGSGVVETWTPNEPPMYDESGSAVALGTTEESELDAEGNAVAADNVQQQMLNGAQVASMVEIGQAVKAGLLTKEQAASIILLSVPGVSAEMADKIAGDYDPTTAPVKEEPAPVAPAKPRLFGARGAAK